MTAAAPTIYPELNGVLHEFVTRVTAVMGKDLVAVYLNGSFAVGDADAHSDVDLLVVTRGEISATQLAALQVMHGQVHELDSRWAKHLEVSYIPKDLLNRLEAVGVNKLWYCDNGQRSLVQDTHDNTWVVRWVVREQGILLVGPDPRTLIDPVPPALLRQEILKLMHRWGGSFLGNPAEINVRWYQPFVVLSYCRMLQTLETGRVQSKLVSARWAQRTLDPRWTPLIQHALDDRPTPIKIKVSQPANPEDLKATLDFVPYMLELS